GGALLLLTPIRPRTRTSTLSSCRVGASLAGGVPVTRQSRNQRGFANYGVSLCPAGRLKGEITHVREQRARRAALCFALPVWHIPQSGWKKPAINAGENEDRDVLGLPAPARWPGTLPPLGIATTIPERGAHGAQKLRSKTLMLPSYLG